MQVSAMGPALAYSRDLTNHVRPSTVDELERRVQHTEDALRVTHSPRARCTGKQRVATLHMLIAEELDHQCEEIELSECHRHIADVWNRAAKAELHSKPRLF